MLFSELLEGQTWTYAGVALRRIHKDQRARKYLGSMLGKLLVIPSVLFAVVVALGSVAIQPANISSVGIFVGLTIGFVIRTIRREHKYWATFHAEEAMPEPARLNVLRTGYWLAAIFQRLDSEIYLQKEIPPEIQIITRRVVLDQLRTQGIWEEIPSGVRNLLLKPDGHWTALERDFVAGKFEHFRCLRWLVRKDTFLRWLLVPPQYDLRHAGEVVKDADWFGLKRIASPFKIQEQCKIAVNYANRCWLEGVARGLVASDPEQHARAVEGKKSFRPNGDFLFGNKTVGTLADDELRRLFQRARLRSTTLQAAENEITLTPDKGTLQRLMEESFADLSAVQAESESASAAFSIEVSD